MSEETEVLLPTTETQLDEFVASITKEFGLPEGDETYDAIATMIMHLPSHRAYAPRSFFGNGVLRAMANAAAYKKLRELQLKRMEKEKTETAEQEKVALTLVETEANAVVDKPLQNA